MYGYRTAKDATPEQRRNATPKMNADKNIGEWNTFHITVQGNAVMLRPQRTERDPEVVAARPAG